MQFFSSDPTRPVFQVFHLRKPFVGKFFSLNLNYGQKRSPACSNPLVLAPFGQPRSRNVDEFAPFFVNCLRHHFKWMYFVLRGLLIFFSIVNMQLDADVDKTASWHSLTLPKPFDYLFFSNTWSWIYTFHRSTYSRSYLLVAFSECFHFSLFSVAFSMWLTLPWENRKSPAFFVADVVWHSITYREYCNRVWSGVLFSFSALLDQILELISDRNLIFNL